jgi:hypothetical protein
MSTSCPGRGHRRSLAEARDLVLAWRACGLNKEAWCRSQWILRSALHSCLTRVDQADGVTARPVSSGFLEELPPRSLDASAIEGLRIELGGGRRVVGLELVDVISVLRAMLEVRT